jgi:phage-related protein
MANLSLATAIEKARLDSSVPFVVALDITPVNGDTGAMGEKIYVVRNDENLTFNGRVYTAAMFDVSFGTELGTQGQTSLSMNDYSGGLRAKMSEFGGGVGFLVKLTIINAAALDDPPEFEHEYETLSAKATGYVVEFGLGAENDTLRQFPRHRQRRDFCRFRYKDGSTCGYTGPLPSCDYTLQGPNGCAAHLNTIRFGGFPGIQRNGYRYG